MYIYIYVYIYIHIYMYIYIYIWDICLLFTSSSSHTLTPHKLSTERNVPAPKCRLARRPEEA